jgi:hypothetical protein
VGQFDLGRGAVGGEHLLDLVEVGRARYAVEAEPRDLVGRRVVLGEARHPPPTKMDETLGAAALGTFGAFGHQQCLGPLDPLGESDVAEQGIRSAVMGSVLVSLRDVPSPEGNDFSTVPEPDRAVVTATAYVALTARRSTCDPVCETFRSCAIG